METSSFIILPIIVLTIIIYGFKHKINIYDEFLIGAKEGIITTFKIIPNLVAMIFAVNILVKSNIISDIFSFLTPYLTKFDLTSDIIPMCFLRSVSGNSTLALMINIFNKYGIIIYLHKKKNVPFLSVVFHYIYVRLLYKIMKFLRFFK